MQEEPNRTDLSTITDEAQLNALYVQCSEVLAEAQARANMESQNLQAIRGRMAQLRSESLSPKNELKPDEDKAEKTA